jgi:hypothetical protein
MWNTWQAHGGPATKQASVQNSMPLIVTVLCATSRRLNEVGSTGWGVLALLREQLGGAGAGCGDDRIGDRFVNGDAGDDYVARLEWVGGSVVAKTGLLDCYWEGLAGAADSFERCDAFYKNSRIKQYLKDGRALRIETVINSPDDLRCHRRLVHLDELQARARAVNTTLLDTERVGQGCVLASPAFERIARPTLTEDGRRAPALRFGDPRVQALAGALCTSVFAVAGITNKSLRALMTGLLGATTYSMNQASYDLARLRINGLIDRIPGKNRYRLTDDGLRFAIFYTKLHDRLLRPLLAADQPPAPPPVRKALRTIDIHITETIHHARLLPKAA